MNSGQTARASQKGTSEERLTACVVGLRRSGNHAIIRWIIDRSAGVVVHLNDIDRGSRDPWIGCRSVQTKGVRYWSVKRSVPGLLRHVVSRNEVAKFIRRDTKFDVRRLRDSVDWNVLVASYEDQAAGDVLGNFASVTEAESAAFQPREPHHVVVIRDPFNTFASLLWSGRVSSENQLEMRDLWKHHAGLALRCQGSGPIWRAVLFNRWVADRDYRFEVGTALGLNDPSAPLHQVPDFGGGSSFDGRKPPSGVGAMQLGNRWRRFENDEGYWSIFDDEVFDLTADLFGSEVIPSRTAR